MNTQSNRLDTFVVIKSLIKWS